MTALSKAIAATKPREKSGARTGARYAFQAHASLAKVLELYDSEADFRAIFDHFDDLAVFDSADVPTGVSFYQIKGKEKGQWTAARLSASSGEAPSTIVGKMYHHTVNFGSSVEACIFLTNAAFNFALAAGGRTTSDHVVVPYDLIGSEDQTRLTSALELDFPSPRTPTEEAVIRFERTDVPLKRYDVFLKGMLVEFIENKSEEVTISALYRTLVMEISAKSNDTTECETLSEIFVRKSLSRDDLSSIFVAANKRSSILDHWKLVDDELKGDGRSIAFRIRVRTATVEYLRARSKRIPEIVMLASVVQATIDNLGEDLETAESPIEAAALLIKVMPTSVLDLTDDIGLEAALLSEAYEALYE